MVGFICLLTLTLFAATICGSVLLIQLGGWLAILSAVLIFASFFIEGVLLMLLGVAFWDTKKKFEALQKKGDQ